MAFYMIAIIIGNYEMVFLFLFFYFYIREKTFINL